MNLNSYRSWITISACSLGIATLIKEFGQTTSCEHTVVKRTLAVLEDSGALRHDLGEGPFRTRYWRVQGVPRVSNYGIEQHAHLEFNVKSSINSSRANVTVLAENLTANSQRNTSVKPEWSLVYLSADIPSKRQRVIIDEATLQVQRDNISSDENSDSDAQSDEVSNNDETSLFGTLIRIGVNVGALFTAAIGVWATIRFIRGGVWEAWIFKRKVCQNTDILAILGAPISLVGSVREGVLSVQGVRASTLNSWNFTHTVLQKGSNSGRKEGIRVKIKL